MHSRNLNAHIPNEVFEIVYNTVNDFQIDFGYSIVQKVLENVIKYHPRFLLDFENHETRINITSVFLRP